MKDARVRWLEDELRDRFCDDLLLIEKNGNLAIHFVGEPKSISFSPSVDFTATPAVDLPCGSWSPRLHGWLASSNQALPMPGARSSSIDLVQLCPGGYRIGYDILGLMSWMLSRQEEVGRDDLDTHGRFPATSSHAFKHGYLERPIVDEWLDILGQAMARLWPALTIRCATFETKVSHDVDAPSRYQFSTARELFRGMAGDVVKRRNYRAAIQSIGLWATSKNRLNPNDPNNTFSWLMDVSEEHGMASAFYFICGRSDPTRDALYEPEHPAIRTLMREIHERGHEIGLHPSYNTYQDPNAIVAEANTLRKICGEEGIEQKAWGGRMHFLRFEVPKTFYGWIDSDMTYDSTLGYADRPGFRCGTCFEYQAFDPVAEQVLNLRIRPLIAMECTIIDDQYMGLGTGEAALKKFRALKVACQTVNGTFTLLWHNSRLTTQSDRCLYRAILG